MSLRRMLPFILINIVVSTIVFLLLLSWWDSREVGSVPVAPTEQVASAVNTPIPVDFVTPGAEQEPDTAPQEEDEQADGEGEAEDGPATHIVQAGETLGVISQQYDVPVEDIAAANDIVNVNAISVGQALIIPIGGLPTATPEPTVTASATPEATNTATPAPEEAVIRVEITEILGVGELTSEAVRITNAGTRPLMLQSWQLEDESGNVYVFGSVTLFGSSDAGAPSILIHTEAGQNGPSDLYWGLESAVWQAGETATLRDDLGETQATYEIP